ncbi:MAG: hypothetical protein ABIQ31_04080 [Ferruginibacter sp.]
MKTILLCSVILCSINFTYAQSGMLDPSFGINGVIKGDLGSPLKVNSSARQALLRPDGSMYVLLDATFVTKRLANGSIDSSYGIGGYSRFVAIDNGYAALQADDKIVIAGSKVNGSIGFNVTRLNVNGTADTAFGVNGMQITEFDGSSFARSVVIQGDGKIVVAGSINERFGVVRYNANGSVDSTFNSNGQQVTDFGTYSQVANSVAIQTDGKIVAGGVIYTDFGASFGITRYNKDGSPDLTFDQDGRQVTDFPGAAATGNSLAIQNDGKILLAGYLSDESGNNYFVVTRYNTNGSLDQTFNKNGIQTISLNSDLQHANSMALQTNGKIIITGYALNGASNDFVVVCLNADGSLDNTFTNKGILMTDFNAADDIAGAVAIRNDNKIVVAGYSVLDNDYSFSLARYNANGTPDTSFNQDGKLSDDSKHDYTVFNCNAIDADEKVIVVGRTWNGSDYDFAVARYNNKGILDSTFSNDGKLTTDFGVTDEAISVAIQADKKIIVAGNTDNSKFAVARYNFNGTPDLNFGNGGKLILALGIADVCQSVVVQADGKILVAGYSYTDPNYDSAFYAILRLNSNGTLDNTFSNDGKQITDFEFSPSFAASMAIQNDGRIVVAGRSYINGQNNFSVARYNINGTMDMSFSLDGKQYNAFGADWYSSSSMAIQKDGKIVLVGYSSDFSGANTSFAAARYKANGQLDSTFGNQGYQAISLGPEFNFAKSVAINNEGKIAVAGTNGNFATVLYKANGSRDSSFGTNGIQITQVGTATSSIQSIQFFGDKLYAAGYGSYPGSSGVLAKYLVPNDPVNNTFTTRVNGTWNAPATWMGGVVPTANSQVIVRHNVTITTNATCYSLKVEPTGGSITVTTGARLTITH